MTTEDAKNVILAAVQKAGITSAHRLRLHDSGTQFVSRQFKQFLTGLGIRQVRTAYRHPETNGRLERYHLSLKDATARLERYGDPTAARAAIERFVYEYNTQRPHQALDYVTPAAAHFGYADELRGLRLQRREQDSTVASSGSRGGNKISPGHKPRKCDCLAI